MRKVWINVKENSYQTNAEWKLGTIVGEQKCKRYNESASMAQQMIGDHFWIEEKYLVQLDGGSVHAVWDSEAFDIVLDGIKKEAKK